MWAERRRKRNRGQEIGSTNIRTGESNCSACGEGGHHTTKCGLTPSFTMSQQWRRHVSQTPFRKTAIVLRRSQDQLLTQKSRAFLWRAFFGRGIPADLQIFSDFSGSNACSILSNQVNSSNESRADPCPIGRIHYCPNVFSFWKRRNTPHFERFFLEKRP